MTISNGGYRWQEDAACNLPENKPLADAFFSSDAADKLAAKNLCYTCDVRQDCIVYALESNTIWGIWGGRDENEIRRTLSLSAEGNEVRRGRYPQCGYCSARTSKLFVKIIDLPEGGRWSTAKVVQCSVCDTEWRSRSSANAVIAYHTERAVEQAKSAKTAYDLATKALEEANEELKTASLVESLATESFNKAKASLKEKRYDELRIAIATEEKGTAKMARREARNARTAVSRASARVDATKAAFDAAYARSKSSPKGPKSLGF